MIKAARLAIFFIVAEARRDQAPAGGLSISRARIANLLIPLESLPEISTEPIAQM